MGQWSGGGGGGMMIDEIIVEMIRSIIEMMIIEIIME